MARSYSPPPSLPVRGADGIVVSGTDGSPSWLPPVRRLPLLSLVFLCAFGSSCEERGGGAQGGVATIEIVDAAGRTVRLAAPARRVVSLVPGATDVVLALGEAERLVARTRYDVDGRIAHLPSLGDALMPSVEWITAQRPELVIAWPDRQSRTVVTRLEELGIPVYAWRAESLAAARTGIAQVGALLGVAARADSMVAALDSTLDAVQASVRALPRRSVLYIIGLDPPQAAGPGTFVHEMIAVAGGVNAFADAGALWPTISVEEALRRQPDVVILSTASPDPERLREQLRVQPGWRNMHAVREGRLYTVDASVMNRPGASLGRAVAILARTIHGR